MTDLWTEASRDIEAETLDRTLTTARVASASVWPFLAAAVSPEDYANRKALAGDRIERCAAVATQGDPALFSAVHAALLDAYDEDFAVVHGERVATRIEQETKTRAQQQREASLREAIAAETLRRVQAAETEECPECSGSGAIPAQGGEKPEDIDNGQVKCGTCDGTGRVPFSQYGGDRTFESRRKTAGEVPEAFKEQQKKGDGAKDDDSEKDGDEMPDFIKEKIEDGKKESALRYVECLSCKNKFEDDSKLGAERCPKCQSSELKMARKTASTYCPNHGVYVGEGNSEQHNECKTEQRESKDARKTAAPEIGESSTCTKCGGLIHFDNDNGWAGDEDPSSMGTCPQGGKHKPDKTAARRTAAPNPFPPQAGGEKKAPDNGDAGAPDAKGDDAQQGPWACPNCQSANAYTQGGVDLDVAQRDGTPIKCGDCGTIQDPNAPQQQPTDAPAQSPNQAPVQASLSPVAEEAFGAGFEDAAVGQVNASRALPPEAAAAYQAGYTGYQQMTPAMASQVLAVRSSLLRNDKSLTPRTATVLAVTAAGNAYDAGENPYVTGGVPDDMGDGQPNLPTGHATLPTTTRPRQTPGGNMPDPTKVTQVTQGFASLASFQKSAYSVGDRIQATHDTTQGDDRVKQGDVWEVTKVDDDGRVWARKPGARETTSDTYIAPDHWKKV